MITRRVPERKRPRRQGEITQIHGQIGRRTRMREPAARGPEHLDDFCRPGGGNGPAIAVLIEAATISEGGGR